ncbi:ABC-three component system middle component 6 [uncultured Draconibacterium sp.]|uniref:ABC-three component system middle component 6 n=1 Tax=uncultured Draconibacterium sp. TaxID=1573823 RepID=UPI003216E1E4
MILPGKHISLSESLLGLGGILLGFLKTPMTVDELWFKYSKINNSRRYPAYHNFDNVILALDYLFLIGAIEVDDKGKLILCV